MHEFSFSLCASNFSHKHQKKAWSKATRKHQEEVERKREEAGMNQSNSTLTHSSLLSVSFLHRVPHFCSGLSSLSVAAALLFYSGRRVFRELSGVTDPTRLFSLSFLSLIGLPLPPALAEVSLSLSLSLRQACLAGRDTSLHFVRDQWVLPSPSDFPQGREGSCANTHTHTHRVNLTNHIKCIQHKINI